MAAASPLVAILCGLLACARSAGTPLPDDGTIEPIRTVQRCPLGSRRCTPACEWPHAQCNAHIDPSERERVAVVITAWGRSGTTFLGELLQRNGRFLYVYEPIRSQFRAHFGAPVANHGESSADFLVRVADCAPHRRDRAFLFKDKPGLARGGLCGSSPPEVVGLCRCKHTAVKTIRINGELEHLLHALRSTNRSTYESGRAKHARPIKGGAEELVPPRMARTVHVVHLIRDPRALLNSWQTLPGFTQFTRRTPARKAYQLAQQLCSKSMRDYAHGRAPAVTAPGVERRATYTLVRFEDLALRPVQTARALYRSLGLELPRRLMQWVNESTHAERGRAPAALEAVAHGDVSAVLRNPHSTLRDSHAVVFKWRRTLHPEHIKAISEGCGSFLRQFGYPTADDPRALASDDNVRGGDKLLNMGEPDNEKPITVRGRALRSGLDALDGRWASRRSGRASAAARVSLNNSQP